MQHYNTTGYRVFTAVNNTFLVLIALLCLLPFLHILAVSFSADYAADSHMVKLWPVEFTTKAWAKTFGDSLFFRSLVNGIERTVWGTLLSVVVTTLAAYALSKERFKGRSFYVTVFIISLMFNGGLIPTFLLIKNLSLMDTLFALILPTAVNVWNMIILINFFRNTVPRALEESAFMDGANHFGTLIYIYVPVALPAIATVTLFTMVVQWNSWFDGLIYMRRENYPLTTLLQTIVVQRNLSQLGTLTGKELEAALLSQRSLKASQIFIGALPIMMAYPFFQRFFVKGMALGAVKE